MVVTKVTKHPVTAERETAKEAAAAAGPALCTAPRSSGCRKGR